MKNKALYFFFRDREEGATAAWLRGKSDDDVRGSLAKEAALQLKSEGFPIPEDAEPALVLPGEWAGELEAQMQTPVNVLLSSIEWYFAQKGDTVSVSPYAYLGETGKPKQFWMSAHAMLPVWVTSTEPKADPDAASVQSESAPPPQPEAAPVPDAPPRPNAPLEQKNTAGFHPWQNVYIFISSTFNAMHGERNELIKHVFPALSQWCASHHLRLWDIDLRWGITEEDSMENRRTVEICLENIDRCRPFFLCFVGQRRGWVPDERDIADHTYECFPKLKEKLGTSVTEMEVIHALIDPMRRQTLSDEDALMRAFFYLRDAAYLADITSPALRNIYTNQNSADPARDDRLLTAFRTQTVPQTNRPCRSYTCRWDPAGSTPELGAVHNAPAGITEGALTDFRCGGKPLADIILEDLKAAIAERYHLTDDEPEGSELSAELEQQALFLQTAGEMFIERADDLTPFEQYVQSAGTAPLILTAPAGMGKSSLLAHWILETRYRVYYRFIGKSIRSGTAAGLAYSLWQQLHEEGRLEEPPPENTADLLDRFADALGEAAAKNALILVIDAVDQLPGGAQDIAFLPHRLPDGVKLLISVREDAPGTGRYLAETAAYAEIVHVKPLADPADRSALVNTYLGNYLKKLSDQQLAALIQSPGAVNPLYLKIVLSELRVFGSYDMLQSHIEQDFGDTPHTAFDAMLRRIEADAPVSGISMKTLATNVFGWLSHARYGMEARELAELLVAHGACADRENAKDAIFVLVRQLRDFLTERDSRIDFFYNSFREVCVGRYTKNKPSMQWHKELAQYFETQAVNDRHSLLERAYQCAASGQLAAYLSYVMDYRYIEAQLSFGGVQALQRDYALCDLAETELMTAFLGLAGDVLMADPDQLPIRLAGHLSVDPPPAIRALLKQAERAQQGTLLQLLTPCFEAPRSGREKVISTHGKMEAGVALLRQDTCCAAICDERTILVWDLASGSIIETIAAPEGTRFVHLEPVHGGTQLAAGTTVVQKENGRSSEILVYETESFTCTLRFSVIGMLTSYRFYNTHYFMKNYRFSVCGEYLILPDRSNLIRVYRLTDGSIAAQTQLYRWNARCAALSENGIAAVGNMHPQNGQDGFDDPLFKRISNPVSLFQMSGDALIPLRDPLGEWKYHVQRLCLSPDGKLLAASDGFHVLIYDIGTGALIKDIAQEQIEAIRFLPKRNLLLLAGASVMLYETDHFDLVSEYRGMGQCGAAAVSADESFVLLQTDERKLRVLSIADLGQKRRAYSAPLPIRSVALSPDGKGAFTSCYENYVAHGKERTPGVSDDPKLFRFDLQTGACEEKMRLCSRTNRDHTYLMPDGTAAVSKNFEDRGVFSFRYWEIPLKITDGEELYADLYAHERAESGWISNHPGSMQFSADRRFMVIWTYSVAYLYRVKTGRLIGQVTMKRPETWLRKIIKKDTDHTGSYMSGAYFDVTDDGQYLTVLFTDYEKPRIEQYDVRKNKQLYSRPLADGSPLTYSQLDFSNTLMRVVPDRRIVFVCEEIAAVFDADTGKTLLAIDKKQAGCFEEDFFAACSGDGHLLCISGKRDEHDANDRLQIYDTLSGLKIGTFVADGKIGEMQFEPDGETVLFGMGNGRLCRLHIIQS